MDDLSFAAPKTKEFAAFLGKFNLEQALVVVGETSANAELSGRNIPTVRVLQPIGVNVYDVLRRSHLVLTRAAVEALTTRLGGQ